LLQVELDRYCTLEDETMKRWTLAALAAASLLSATAIASTQLSQVETRSTTARPTHWRSAEPGAREKVGEYMPSVTAVAETGGASVIPSF
jgi:hypothetical protein